MSYLKGAGGVFFFYICICFKGREEDGLGGKEEKEGREERKKEIKREREENKGEKIERRSKETPPHKFHPHTLFFPQYFF